HRASTDPLLVRAALAVGDHLPRGAGPSGCRDPAAVERPRGSTDDPRAAGPLLPRDAAGSPASGCGPPLAASMGLDSEGNPYLIRCTGRRPPPVVALHLFLLLARERRGTKTDGCMAGVRDRDPLLCGLMDKVQLRSEAERPLTVRGAEA